MEEIKDIFYQAIVQILPNFPQDKIRFAYQLEGQPFFNKDNSTRDIFLVFASAAFSGFMNLEEEIVKNKNCEGIIT